MEWRDSQEPTRTKDLETRARKGSKKERRPFSDKQDSHHSHTH